MLEQDEGQVQHPTVGRGGLVRRQGQPAMGRGLGEECSLQNGPPAETGGACKPHHGAAGKPGGEVSAKGPATQRGWRCLVNSRCGCGVDGWIHKRGHQKGSLHLTDAEREMRESGI